MGGDVRSKVGGEGEGTYQNSEREEEHCLPKEVSYVYEQSGMHSSGGDAYRERLQGSISYIDRWRYRCLEGLYELTEIYN